jgi:hypothetical protein
MRRYEATFEIDSKADAHAVSRLMDRVYDSLREESTIITEGETESNQMLEAFDALRDAVGHEASGRFTIIYEERDDEM